MSHLLYFWTSFFAIAAVIFFLDKKYAMLRDSSSADPKPYSFSRVQWAWWATIVLSCMISMVFYTGQLPVLNDSTLVLLGISTATSAVARLTDVADKTVKGRTLIQDDKGMNFFLDILTDNNGVSLSRFQTLVFNVTFGFWFIHEVLAKLVLPGTPVDDILPVIGNNNLILLGFSSATYAGFKTTENK